MRLSFKHLAISYALHMVTMKWVAESVMIALGAIKDSLSIDFLKLTRVSYSERWGGWIEEGVEILKIKVIPTISPPFALDIRPP